MPMPALEDLTEEQRRIVRLPDEGRYFIGGPPGTGKTILMLLRAAAMARRSDNTEAGRAVRPEIITYNWQLNGYCWQMLQSQKLKLNVKTYHGWLKNHYREHYCRHCEHYSAKHCERYDGKDWEKPCRQPPRLAMLDGAEDRWHYDWRQIADHCVEANPAPADVPLLIDEGQDLPKEFYEYISVHFKNIMVFADENQQISDRENCSKETIWEKLLINDSGQKHMLTINHRNTLEIARVALHFYVGTDAGKPVLPERRGAMPALLAYDDIRKLADRVVNHAGLHPRALIGVITANNESQDVLKAALEQRCKDKKVVFKFIRSGNKENIDFGGRGIVLLNIQAVKGLEFHSVFIADLHEHFVRRNGHAHQMKLYVATARAKEQLFICYDREKKCPLLEFMPDENILRREALD